MVTDAQVEAALVVWYGREDWKNVVISPMWRNIRIERMRRAIEAAESADEQ